MEKIVLEHIKRIIDELITCRNKDVSFIAYSEEVCSLPLTGKPFYLDAVDLFYLCDAIEADYSIVLPDDTFLRDVIVTVNSLCVAAAQQLEVQQQRL